MTLSDEDYGALKELCVELVHENKAAEAIKFFREMTGHGLREGAFFVCNSAIRAGIKREELPPLLKGY